MLNHYYAATLAAILGTAATAEVLELEERTAAGLQRAVLPAARAVRTVVPESLRILRMNTTLLRELLFPKR